MSSWFNSHMGHSLGAAIGDLRAGKEAPKCSGEQPGTDYPAARTGAVRNTGDTLHLPNLLRCIVLYRHDWSQQHQLRAVATHTTTVNAYWKPNSVFGTRQVVCRSYVRAACSHVANYQHVCGRWSNSRTVLGTRLSRRGLQRTTPPHGKRKWCVPRHLDNYLLADTRRLVGDPSPISSCLLH